MYLRRLSVPFAIVSSLVGLGAWYSTTSGERTASSLTRNFPTARDGDGTLTGAAAAATTRKVLVLGSDDFQTGTFVGEGPISKTTSDDGRKIVEMMTPDQATQAMRKLEKSWVVNRGEGVVRYDTVQLPSNDPIEDDHSEQVITVPALQGGGTDDWMFWGVFDGHR